MKNPAGKNGDLAGWWWWMKMVVWERDERDGRQEPEGVQKERERKPLRNWKN